ncbi:MAG: wax ester/triacylglycerol synthase family O-acyltransferase [Halioglobus sp.]
MKQLTPTDSIFVFNESSTAPLHISPLLIYGPPDEGQSPVRFKDILQRFQQRLHKSPVFRRKLSRVPLDLDRPYWVEDENFDLEFHVRHMALPKPGDWRQFCILLARLHSRPLDLNRPPWEAYVIEGLDNITGLPSGSFALYMKIHHSAIDGATGNQMIEALHDLAPIPAEQAVEDDWQGEAEPGAMKKVGKAYVNLLRSPKKARALVDHAIKSYRADIRQIVGGDAANHEIKVRTRFNDSVTSHRVFGGLRMDLSDLKFIKNTVGDCTLNDVLLSIVAGSMRHYLEEKGELPDQSLVVGVPISTRSQSNTNTEGGNEIAGMRLNLRTDIADPIDRLKEIHRDAMHSKAYANAIGAERLTTMINSLPSGLTSLGMRTMAATGLNARTPISHTIVTNVPGPQFPMYFCGTKALFWIGMGCVMDGMGLFHTINSYNGNVFLSFLSCRSMLSDPDFYHQCINRSLDEHMKGAQALVAKG